MSYTSDILALTLQDLDDNPDTWGTVLNEAALELIEKGFVATTVDVTSSSVTLDDTQGSDVSGHYRYGIIKIIGSPGAARNVNVPVDLKNGLFVQKSWIVLDSTSGGQTITFKTSTGTGIDLISGEAVLCWCDGTNIVGTSVENAVNASNATLAATATNATQLGGIAAAGYGQLDVRNTWTKGQVVQRAVLTNSGGIVTPNLTTSNSFYCSWAGNWQLAAPAGSPVNGDQFSIVIQQAAGAPWTISYAATTYIWEGGTAGVLSTVAGDVDYLAFEYCSNITGGGGQWIGTILNDLS